MSSKEKGRNSTTSPSSWTRRMVAKTKIPKLAGQPRKVYEYQSKEQWKADYVFLKLQLKQAKAQVVVNIFKTDTISKPSNFLRRFWAATGVPKTKPITDVVADILNSKNG